MFKQIVSSDTVDIHAPADLIWDIIVDFERYPEWNPFTFKIKTDLEIGSPIHLYVNLGGRKIKQIEYVQTVDKPHLVAWGMTMGARFLLTARREQVIEELETNVCRYVSTDAFRGILTPIIVAIFGKHMENGFTSVAYALKERAEAMHQEQQRQAG